MPYAEQQSPPTGAGPREAAMRSGPVPFVQQPGGAKADPVRSACRVAREW